MKIMQIISGSAINGAIRHCLLLSRELARRGHDVTLVCRPNAWIGGQVKSDPIRLIESDLHRWPTGELRRIAAILDQEGYDVVHTHMSRAHLFGVLLRLFTRVPRVATAQSRHFQPHWALNDMVIAASEATRLYHRRFNLVPARQIITIHNFIDGSRFESLPADVRTRVRVSLGIADSDPLICVVGNVIPRKGQLYAIRALPRILAAHPSTRMIFAGEEELAYFRRVRAEADTLGVSSRVHWLGLRNDIHELLAAGDLFVLPALEETLPLAILEAMAIGLPTVATTVGGNAECVVQGETGLLVPPRNHTALAEAVCSLLTDAQTRRQMGQAAQRRYRESFSMAKQTAAIEAVFKQVVSRRRLARAA